MQESITGIEDRRRKIAWSSNINTIKTLSKIAVHASHTSVMIVI